MSNNKGTYFAAADAKECASSLIMKSDSFFNTLQSNMYLDKLNTMYRFYYGNSSSNVGDGHRVEFVGEQGELVSIPVNHFRNLAQHIYVMITANRPVMDARSINSDYKSMSQTYVANSILDYYMRQKKLEDNIKKAAEMAIVLGAGFIKAEWNATAGEEVEFDEENGVPIYQGDLEFSNLSPFDVIFDGTKESWNHDWIMVRGFKNRYDLMAKYPEHADRIKSIPSKSEQQNSRIRVFSNDETDDITIYEFYHKRTDSVPNGRYMLFLDSDVIAIDTALPYRKIPIFRISAGDIMGTPYAYSPMFDIAPIQEGISSLYSTIMTNQNAFGVQNLFVPRGADIAVNQLEGGMNVIEGNDQPVPLQLTSTPVEVFDFLKLLIQTGETLSGVNSVARGDPQASLKSGTALALVQSMALQFQSGLQQSYVQLIEDVGTSVIEILKDYATAPRMIEIVGKNNKAFLKEFTGEEISSINRVVVDMGNPLSRSIAGRVQMAEQLLQMNLLKTPEQYFQVINTGRIEATFEGEMSELLLIRRENELMMDGESPIVSPLDTHQLHIMEHKSVLADPELRRDPALVKNVLDHIEGHLDALRNTDPALLQITGQQPLPPAGMPPEGQMAPEGQAPEGEGAAPMMAPNQGLTVPGQPIQGPNVDNVGLPNLPTVDPSLLPNPGLQPQ